MFLKRHTLSSFVCLFWVFGGTRALACGQDAVTAAAYQQAITLFDRGAYAEALPLFERVYAQEPLCIGAKLDIAVTYFRLEQYAPAQRLFREILALPGIAEGIRQQCEGFLSIMEERTPTAVDKVRKLPRMQLSAGVGVSDNVNNGLRVDHLVIGGGDEPLTLQLGDKSKANPGVGMMSKLL